MDSQNNLNSPIAYCLYARRSLESDERQTMSIDGQLSEMKAMAKKQKLIVSEIITESHSAKQSGQRPEFNRLLQGIIDNKYSGILTWAPDRLSRNAGDLGRLVDLIDQGKLIKIQTYSQSFSNNPNEKFLLMILCSQAKLENDNRGINIRRGLRSKCEAGYFPGRAPLGYLNVIKLHRITTVVVDLERGPVVKEMFRKVAEEGYSGRMIRGWLKSIDFKTKSNHDLALSKIYEALHSTFYYGYFKFGTKLYKGAYEPLITKQTYDKVQFQLEVVPKQWNKQLFPFKKICKCGSCGGSVTAEIKYKRLISGKFHSHIYYHCNRIKKYDCSEPYITEKELIKQLIANLPNIKLKIKFLMEEFDNEISKFKNLKDTVLKERYPNIRLTPYNPGVVNNDESYSEEQISMLKEYLLHVLQFGSPEDRIKILAGVTTKFKLTNRSLQIA